MKEKKLKKQEVNYDRMVALQAEKLNNKLYYQLEEISPDVEMTKKTVALLVEKLLPADEVLR